MLPDVHLLVLSLEDVPKVVTVLLLGKVSSFDRAMTDPSAALASTR